MYMCIYISIDQVFLFLWLPHFRMLTAIICYPDNNYRSVLFAAYICVYKHTLIKMNKNTYMYSFFSSSKWSIFYLSRQLLLLSSCFSWPTSRFASPSVICSRFDILVKSQACQTKGRVFEPQSGHFLVTFFVSIVCPYLNVKHSSQSLIWYYCKFPGSVEFLI